MLISQCVPVETNIYGFRMESGGDGTVDRQGFPVMKKARACGRGTGQIAFGDGAPALQK
ncbi:MAG: hypothetical protein PHY64_07235 [Eubacteriales bacterium]|nr:hypothetical protein [Eubacteriales bacterium]